MTARIIKLFSILALISSSTFGQEGVDYSLYTSISVFSKTGNYRNDIQEKISNSRFRNIHKPGKAIVLISDSSIINKFINKKVLIGYLINNSADTLLIDRCDEAILKSETQVFTDSNWVTLELNLPSDCGNSYFRTKLPPGSYYILQIPDPTNGEIETKFRVKFTYQNETFYSNPVIVKLTQERIEKTRQEIKPVPWSD